MSSSTPRATVLGHGARVAGDLHLDHDAVLAGEITGNILAKGHVELAANAVVQGDLHAASLSLAGHVAGHVVVQHTTELHPGGTLQGRLDTGHLVVIEGASYEGQLRLRRCVDEAPRRSAHAPEASALSLNRTPVRRQVDLTEAAKNQADGVAFNAIPGTVNAGLRPRRRVPGASAG